MIFSLVFFGSLALGALFCFVVTRGEPLRPAPEPAPPLNTTGPGPVIKLNFINQSDDLLNPDILIFQKNGAENAGNTAVAWQVIHNCGPGDNHPFVFATDTFINVSDSWGNFTPQLPAQNGQAFDVTQTTSGTEMAPNGSAPARQQIDVSNKLRASAISAMLYRSGKLVAQHAGIAPGETRSFVLTPTIWIGVVSEAEEGMLLNEAIMSTIHTEFSIKGLTSADIVMTGGGSGPDMQPYVFTMQNRQPA